MRAREDEGLARCQNSPRVCGVGLACIDEGFLLYSDPTADLVEPARRTRGLGGMVANALATAVKLGSSAKIWTVVGDDQIGGQILNCLTRTGIDCSGTVICVGGASPTTMVVVDGLTGERYLIPREATLPVSAETRVPIDLKVGDVLLVDGFYEHLALSAIKEAKRIGVPVLGDIWIRPEEPSQLTKWIDFLIVCEKVGRRFSRNGTIEDALEHLMMLGPRMVGVTLGGKGMMYTEGNNFVMISAPLVNAVDTSGAGDALHGAFAFGLLLGWEIEACVQFAVVCASMNCRSFGPQIGLPTIGEVTNEMRRLGQIGPWEEIILS